MINRLYNLSVTSSPAQLVYVLALALTVQPCKIIMWMT